MILIPRLLPLGILAAGLCAAQPRMLLKKTPAESAGLQVERSLVPGRVHRIIADSARAEAEAAGARVLRPVPEGAWLVSGDTWALPEAAALEASIKISDEYQAGTFFLAEFHPDVTPAEARAIATECGLVVHEHPDLRPDHLLLEGSPDQAAELAQWDEVAYIFPASEDLVEGRPAIACAGAATTEGTYGQYIARSGEGWDGPGRGSASLGYGFGGLSSKLTADATKGEVARSLAEWSKFVQVSFTPATDSFAQRTIRVLFAFRQHGDPYPFDGPRGVLAHTFYPAPPNPEPLAGDMHFDDDEAWHIGADIDLFSVALHEAGHALGLGHSDRAQDVMYPYYRRATTLSAGDIAAIQEMYAARGTSSPSPAPPAPPAPQPPAAAPRDTTPPSLTITSPAGVMTYTSATSVSLKGTASDNVGVTRVTWTSLTASGTASGTASWSTDPIPLLVGSNLITVRAYDAAGNSSWRSATITRK